MKFSFVGLVHNCLGSDENLLDKTFGPITMYVHTKDSLGENQPKSQGVFLGILRILSMVLKSRLTGVYQNTPFFVSGSPIVTPKVLSKNELAEAKKS